MTTTNQPRPNPVAERMARFRNDCPGVGQEVPAIESVTLEGEAWSLEALRGRVVVLETGSFT
jgi:hypothetical protein